MVRFLSDWLDMEMPLYYTTRVYYTHYTPPRQSSWPWLGSLHPVQPFPTATTNPCRGSIATNTAPDHLLALKHWHWFPASWVGCVWVQNLHPLRRPMLSSWFNTVTDSFFEEVSNATLDEATAGILSQCSGKKPGSKRHTFTGILGTNV